MQGSGSLNISLKTFIALQLVVRMQSEKSFTLLVSVTEMNMDTCVCSICISALISVQLMQRILKVQATGIEHIIHFAALHRPPVN